MLQTTLNIMLDIVCVTADDVLPLIFAVMLKNVTLSLPSGIYLYLVKISIISLSLYG